MARSRTTRQRDQALDAALRGMFSAVRARVLPDSLRCVIDQLEEAAREPEDKAA